jgi:hypothetical protein
VPESYHFRLAATDGTASGHEGCKKPKGISISESALRDIEAAAIGQQVLVFEITTGRGIDEAFESLACEKVNALFVTGGGFFGTRRVQLAVLAIRPLGSVPAGSASGRVAVNAGFYSCQKSGLSAVGTAASFSVPYLCGFSAQTFSGQSQEYAPIGFGRGPNGCEDAIVLDRELEL